MMQYKLSLKTAEFKTEQLLFPCKAERGALILGILVFFMA